MKNKIFNAIQEGLINALVFDDNETISYQKSNINNETKFPKVSLDELYNTFKECPNDIFKCYDTKDCMSLILDDNSEISLHEYKMSDNPVFLKISDDTLKNSGNEIIIACDNNHYISPRMLEWQTVKNKQLLPDNYLTDDEEIISDFNGRLKCQLLINMITNNQALNLPAIEYCNNIKSPLTNYKGYLPSIGQLNFILKYLDIINYIFKYFNYNNLNLKDGSWWSSSEYNYYYAWDLNNGSPYYYGCKHNIFFTVLPLFAFENNDLNYNEK